MFAIAESALAERITKLREGALNFLSRKVCETEHLHARRINHPGRITAYGEQSREGGGVLAGAERHGDFVGATAPGVSLILFSLILPPLLFWLAPIASAYSRKHEFEADSYAAEVANSADLITALTKLYKDNANTLTPDPLYSAYHHSHPPAMIRIAHLQSIGAASPQPNPAL